MRLSAISTNTISNISKTNILTIDSTAPTITIVSPPSGYYNYRNLTINVTVNETNFASFIFSKYNKIASIHIYSIFIQNLFKGIISANFID